MRASATTTWTSSSLKCAKILNASKLKAGESSLPHRAKWKPDTRCVKNRPSKNQNHENSNAPLPKRRRPGIAGHRPGQRPRPRRIQTGHLPAGSSRPARSADAGEYNAGQINYFLSTTDRLKYEHEKIHGHR